MLPAEFVDSLFSHEVAVQWQPFPGSPQEAAYHSAADELFYGGSAGGGKALSIYAIIPTPEGYKSMRDLCIGDRVFGVNGEIYQISATSDVMHNHRLFEVVFDDGTIIRADADHRWHTYTVADRDAIRQRSPEQREKRRKNRKKRGAGKRPDLALRNQQQAAGYVAEPVTGAVRTTLEIKETLLVRGRVNHAIPVAAPLQLPFCELPIDPYVLGYWLGDGSSAYGRITIGDEDRDNSLSLIAARGYKTRKQPSGEYAYTILGLQPQLKESGLLKNKHIPDEYLFASFEQRLALLQGLMDTDGHASASGQCEFYSSKKRLIQGVSRLLHTLGIKHAIREKKPPKNTKYAVSYRIKFVAPFPVFQLERKVSRQNTDLRETQKWRYIVDVREVGSEPVKCIAINSPDHLYLAGEECIPTHNSDLLLGLAGTAHRSSVIFRREFPRLRALIERSRAIYNTRGVSHARDSFNESLHIWRLLSGRTVEFASIQHEPDKQKQQGRPRDFYGFDEITEFLESQYRYVTIWNRSTVPGQRCRIVATGNPPMDAAGEWVIQYWGAWLDSKHPNPAEPGELRWYAAINGRDMEVADNTPIDGGINPSTGETEWVTPRSRTFIPARLEDNPILSQTGYRAVLQALGEPMRSQMLYGDFSIGAQDDAWQVIPTEWVTAAQERWQHRTKPAVNCRAIGVDPSRGGADDFVIAKLYGNYFDDPIVHSGVSSADGIIGAKHVTDAMGTDNPPVFIDVIGIGSSVYDHLKVMPNMQITPVNVGAGSSARDKTGRYEFANLRSEQWWQFREALDPNSGENIALPPSRQLRVDLCAPRYQIRAGKIAVESKPDVKKRIGRSTDYADPHLLAWHGVQTGHITTAYPDYD